MKRICALMIALSIALMIGGCGSKVTKGDAGKAVVQGGASVDENGEEIVGTTIDGAGAEVDMDKIEGKALTGTNDSKTAKMGDYKVSVDDAKLTEAEVEGETRKLFVVTFTFKNGSKDNAAFDNVLTAKAYQGESELLAKSVSGVEGLNMRSGVEFIDPGRTTRVQKAYEVKDETTAVTVRVESADGEGIEKTFNLQ